MQIGETDRVAELVKALQVYQKMKDCPRIPTGEDLVRELTHQDASGNKRPNNFGTFTVVAVGTSKSTEASHSDIVGYLIYTQAFSIIRGRYFYINSFFIEEQYRRHGLGRKFIEFLKLHSELVGNDGFDVPFMNNNFIGQKFYKGYGSYLVNEDYHLVSLEFDS